MSLFSRIAGTTLLLLSPAMAVATPECGIPDPAEFAQKFFLEHRSFYYEETPSLKQYVTPSLLDALQNHYRCAMAEGICHLDYEPWLGAQDGNIAGAAKFSTKSAGQGRAIVTMSYRFEIEPGKPTIVHRVKLYLAARGASGCWRVSDLVTPLGDSLAKSYRKR